MRSLNAEAKQLFDQHMKGKNIMTPHLLGYGVAGKYAYEFTEGKDFQGKPMYGITVLRRGTGERRNDLSKAVFSETEAAEWVTALRDL